jgi:hypothetical protein
MFDKLIANVKIIRWICEDCKTMARSVCHRLEAAIAHLTEEFVNIQAELAEVKSSRRPNSIVSSIESPEPTSVAMTTGKTLIDRTVERLS